MPSLGYENLPFFQNSLPSMAHYETQILFNVTSDIADEEPYALSFIGGAWLYLQYVEMMNGPGAVEIVNVSAVEIHNCSFRYVSFMIN